MSASAAAGTTTSAAAAEKNVVWTHLDCSGFQLQHFTKEIGVYDKFLTTLNISNNRLTSLPAAVFKLATLTHLDISNNRFASIDASIGGMATLKILNMSNNRLTKLPTSIGRLHQLDRLLVTGNPLGPSGVPSVLLTDTETPSLMHYFRDNAPSGPEPPSRAYLTSDDFVESETAFSILSYNILAEPYATAQRYPWTPSWALAWDFRRNLILREIVGHQADIVCLQEVQMDVFENDFLPELRSHGYEGVFKVKSRARTMSQEKAGRVDGCATFYRREKFAMLSMRDLEFASLAMQDPAFQADPEGFSRLMTRDNVALVTVLELVGSRPTQHVTVANTHIHFDPKFTDVKLVQVQMLLKQVENMANQHSTRSRKCPVVIAGDFNSTPDSGVYEFIAKGSCLVTHEDLLGRKFFGKDTHMQHTLGLRSAYAAVMAHEPPFTNYTYEFANTIDYIWYTPGTLSAGAVLAPVRKQDAQTHVALPSPHYPSDHTSMAAFLRFS